MPKKRDGEVDIDSEGARAKGNRTLLLRHVKLHANYNSSGFGIIFFGQITYENRWTVDEVCGLQTQNSFFIQPGVTRPITYHNETVSNP